MENDEKEGLGVQDVFLALASIAAIVAAVATAFYAFLTKQMRDLVRVQLLNSVSQMMEETRAARTTLRAYLDECDGTKPTKRPVSAIS